MNTSTARVALFGLLDTWRAAPGPPVYIGPYGTAEAVLTPLEVWHRLQALVAERARAGTRKSGGDRLELMNATDARIALFKLLDEWRVEPGRPVSIARNGTPGAVLAPLVLWHRMQTLVAGTWDIRTAKARLARLQDAAGPQPTSLPDLARLAGCAELPVPVLQSRGVPRGGAALTAWPAALDDLRTLSADASYGTTIAVLRALCSVLLGTAPQVESRCGRGTSYSVTDVDGLHAAILTTRRVRHVAGRRGVGKYETVELVAVDHIGW